MSEREVEFSVEGTPVPQGSVRAFGGHIVHNKDKELRKYRKSIAKVADDFHDMMYTEDKNMGYEISLIFYVEKGLNVKRPLPTVKGKNMGDLDKFTRSVLDALTENPKEKIKGLWMDDCQVVRIKATKYYIDNKHPKPITYIKVRKVLLASSFKSDGVATTFDDDL